MANNQMTVEEGLEASAQPAVSSLGLENLLGYNLRLAHGVQKHRFAAVFGAFAIRPVTLTLLGVIYEHPGIKQSHLVKRLNIKRANMVPLLAELGQRGLIVRRPSNSDRRAQLVTLTAAGKRLTAKLLDAHDRLEADLVRNLGARDSEQLVALLKKFTRLAPKPDLADAE